METWWVGNEVTTGDIEVGSEDNSGELGALGWRGH